MSGTDASQAHLFEEHSEDVHMKEQEQEQASSGMRLELANTGSKSIGISPITDIECVAVPGVRHTYLLTTVSVDSLVRVYAVNTASGNSSKHSDAQHSHSAGIDEYKQYDMNKRHKVLLCDAKGQRSHPKHLEQYGGCWSSDINSDCSVCATGDQFGQIYLWNLVEESEEKKTPTVVMCVSCTERFPLRQRSILMKS